MSKNLCTHIIHFCLSVSSVAQSCLTVCDPMDCSTSGFPVHHQLPEPTQTHVHYAGDANQPSHPPPHLQSFPVSESFPISQFFASGGQSIGVSAWASVLPVNIQDWFLLGLTGLISMQSNRLSRFFKTINCSAFSFLYGPTVQSIHDYWQNHSLD